MILVRMSVGNDNKIVVCKHHNGLQFFGLLKEEKLDRSECVSVIISREMPNYRSRTGIRCGNDAYFECLDGLDQYEMSNKVLGTGTFGKVKMATHRLTRICVAVKQLKRKQYEQLGMEFPPREAVLTMKLNHPNIVILFETIITSQSVVLISELIWGGDLFDFAAQYQQGLPERQCRFFIRQILGAVDYMHRCAVCHRDLKLENIMLSVEGKVKIIDFGFGSAFDIHAKHATLKTFCGSPDYAAPELLRRTAYFGPKVDVWAVGVILYILATGFIPFGNVEGIATICYAWPEKASHSPRLKGLISLIFQYSEDRCTVDDIIAHAWVNDDGLMEPILRHHYNTDDTLNSTGLVAVRDDVLDAVEKIGLPRAETRESVVHGQTNSLSTAYRLLEYDHDEAVCIM